MLISIKELLESNYFSKCEVISGEQGINRQVQEVVLFDAPDGYRWFKSGDFVVTTGYLFKDNPKSFKEAIKFLDEKNISGMGIKLERYLKEVPKEVKDYCDEIQFPLISLPFDVSWKELINEINNIAANKYILQLKSSVNPDYEDNQEYIKSIISISKKLDENEKKVVETNKVLQAIMQNSISGIAYIDNSGIIMDVNSKFEYIFGKRKKDLLMKNFYNLINNIDLKNEKSIVTNIGGREVLIDLNQVEVLDSTCCLVVATCTDDLFNIRYKIPKKHTKIVKDSLYTFEDYITCNDSVKLMLKKAKKFSQTNLPIVIYGESGTGKEILAQAIHNNSSRSSKSFVPINMASLTPSILQSELFGYEEGTFTGASKGGKIGLFEQANEGTIFIDEIGDVPLDFQVKLLRVLEERRVRKLGALDEKSIDVRVIVASNKNLKELVDKGEFREDLFFRLNVLPLDTIPLRMRKDDIRYLLSHYIDLVFEHKDIKLEDIFEEKALNFLLDYKWKGNVRELINLVEYLSVIYEREKIGIKDFYGYMLVDDNENSILLNQHELWVLKQINHAGSNGIGRKAISELSIEKGIEMGEGKIRGIVSNLKKLNLVCKISSRKGTTITSKGKDILLKYS